MTKFDKKWLLAIGFSNPDSLNVPLNAKPSIAQVKTIVETLNLPDKRSKAIVELLLSTEDDDAVNKTKLTNYLLQLWEIMQFMEDQSCSYSGEDLRLLVETLYSGDTEIVETYLKNNVWSRILKGFDEKGSIGITALYVVMAALALTMASIALTTLNLGSFIPNALAVGAGSTWNYIDGIVGTGTATNQFYHGENIAGLANLVVSTTLNACTIAGNVGYATATMSMLAVNALLGFSFAACMFVACGFELLQVSRCSARIRELEDDTSLDSKLTEKLILLEKAKKADHMRSAIFWGGCAIGMTSLAIVGCVTTAGLGIPVVLSALAVLSGIIRLAMWLQDSHTDNLERAMRAKPGSKSLFDRLNDLAKREPGKRALGIDLNDQVTIETVPFGFFPKKTMSMKEYISDLLITDPERAHHLVAALEGSAKPMFTEYLDRRLVKIGQTNGMKLYNALTRDSGEGSSKEKLGARQEKQQTK